MDNTEYEKDVLVGRLVREYRCALADMAFLRVKLIRQARVLKDLADSIQQQVNSEPKKEFCYPKEDSDVMSIVSLINELAETKKRCDEFHDRLKALGIVMYEENILLHY
jgi:hypothetical protein